ncbi:hypothetical protein [uncultured Sphingomonas sp.]|uniref:hypothetical protein n=1 Tax=uncultured Sphingomonas sp. TaxID=158754 RepID=UPI0025EE6F26|nr:hypothetical protein [uncultured Sphingomonas sp.]
MTRGAAALVCGLLLASTAQAAPVDKADRKAFHDLVDRYQMFVVPHCDPATTQAYVARHADRDAAFVRSLQGTKLAEVYARAVADRVRHDRRTVYDCAAPLPVATSAPRAMSAAARRRAARVEARRVAAAAKTDRDDYFAEGDRLFADMVALRDRAVASAPANR